MNAIWQSMPFLEVVADKTGGNEKTLQSDFLDSGKYPIVDQGKTLIAGYTNDERKLCKVDGPVIVFGDHTKCFKYIDFPFCLGADGTKVLKPKIDINERFLFYALQNIHIPDAGYSRHFKYLKQGQIPLPTRDEQKRIAAILDKVDELRRLRQRSLEQIDDVGLSIFIEMFGDLRLNPKGLKIIPLGQASSFVSGGTPNKSNKRYWEGSFPWISPKDMKSPHLFDATDHISELVFKETSVKKISPDTPLIVIRGMILAHTFPIAMARVPVAINQDMKAIEFYKSIDPYFGYWCLKAQAHDILRKVDTAAHGTKKLDTDKLKSLPIFDLPKQAQKSFLDRVERLDNYVHEIENQSAKLAQLSLTLQQRAFQGAL